MEINIPTQGLREEPILPPIRLNVQQYVSSQKGRAPAQCQQETVSLGWALWALLLNMEPGRVVPRNSL